MRAALAAVLTAPPLLWMLIGFALAYLLFFIQPVFWAAPAMQFPRYVPAMDSGGNDLRINLQLTDAWLTSRQSPYTAKYGFA